MAEQEVLLTKEGLKKLEEELNEAKTVKRRDIAEKIKVARGFGDLSENAEYDEAKLEQAQNEDRILVLEQMIRNAQTIDDSKLSKDTVGIGATVKILDKELNETFEYKIVGSSEADPLNGLISNVSPVGRALLGRKKGETVDAQTPSGILQFEILNISR